MTDENNNQPINETPNNQAPETPVVTSAAPENEPQNTTDTPENTSASVPPVSPEKTEPATTPEAPTSEAEQSSQNKNPVEKSNANSEEKNSYIIIDSQEEYMQFMAENASSDIINKNVIFKGISWDKKYDDFKKFGVIKFENCNLEGLNTDKIDLNSINIDEHCTNIVLPEGLIIGEDGYLYPEEFIVEQTATRIKGEIELSAEDYREKLDVISNKNILVEYGAEFKGITFTAEDKLDFSNFQGEITLKNCDLSQLRLENIDPNLSCVINVGENVKLPESLPDGWVMHGNQIINKNAQDLDLILAASNDKVFYEPNPKVIKTKKDFEEYAKNLKKDGGIHLENVVIENVEFGEDLDLSMFRNVEFKNCNFEKVKNFVTSSGGYNFKADAKCVGLDGLVEIEQPVKNSKNKSQNSKENSQNKTKQQKNNQDKSDEQPEVSGGAVVRTINRIIKNNAVVKYYESMDGEFIDVTKAFVSGAVSGDSGKEILQAGGEYALGKNNGDKIRVNTIGGQRLFEDVDKLIENAKKTNPGQFINSIQVKVENSKAAKVVNSAKEGLETAKDWTIQRIKSSKVGRTARYFNCKVKRSKCANIVNNNAKQGLEKLANYAKRNQNIKIGLNVMGDVGKFGLKCMPGVSLGIGMESAYENFRNGDYIRGALEFISPWLDFFPPVGTVISAGIDAGLLAYDIYNAVDDGNKEANKKNQEENDNYQMFIEGIKNRFGGKGGGGEDISAEQIKELYEMYKNLSDEEKMAFLNPPERDGSNPEAPLSFENIKNKMQNVIDGKDSYIDKESKKQTNENNPSQPPVQRKSANSEENQQTPKDDALIDELAGDIVSQLEKNHNTELYIGSLRAFYNANKYNPEGLKDFFKIGLEGWYNFVEDYKNSNDPSWKYNFVRDYLQALRIVEINGGRALILTTIGKYKDVDYNEKGMVVLSGKYRECLGNNRDGVLVDYLEKENVEYDLPLVRSIFNMEIYHKTKRKKEDGSYEDISISLTDEVYSKALQYEIDTYNDTTEYEWMKLEVKNSNDKESNINLSDTLKEQTEVSNAKGRIADKTSKTNTSGDENFDKLLAQNDAKQKQIQANAVNSPINTDRDMG